MNTYFNLQLWEKMQKTKDPAEHKAIGNACGFRADKYFERMNGAPSMSDYATMGGNAHLMAAGVLLRLYAGDHELAALLNFCREHKVRVLEAAVHGGFPDQMWGAASCYPRMSPASHLVSTSTPCYNAFGNGLSAVMDAMDGHVEAQAFLGIESSLETQGELKAAVIACFRALLDRIDCP
jgi:hypothetical protein